MSGFFRYITILIVIISIFASCKKTQTTIYEKRVKVVDISLDRENCIIRNITCVEGDNKYVFDLSVAEYQDGCPLPGDSAFIYYIEGKNNYLRALRVNRY